MKRKKRLLLPLLIAAFSAVLNLFSWTVPGFSDLYTDKVFPVLTGPYKRLTGCFPFSVGELMIGAGLVWLAVLLVLAVSVVPLLLRRPLPKRCIAESSEDGHGMRKTAGAPAAASGFPRRAAFFRATVWLLSFILLIMTLNCFILYHCSSLERTLPGAGRTYSLEDLTLLRDALVVRCNEMAEEMARGDDGEVLRPEEEIKEEARKAVSALAECGYPRFAHFTTRPKGLLFSNFMAQQYMEGYYFPFSMEANYNTVMKFMNKPSAICHELAHTQGYIYEDEANFLSYLACTGSGDPVFVYSGLLLVLYYVDNDFYAAVGKNEYRTHPAISSLVRSDNEFLSDEAWTKVEETAVLDTETVKKAADTFVDTTLKVNGVKSGKVSYSYVVKLLLMYYDGDLGWFNASPRSAAKN